MSMVEWWKELLLRKTKQGILYPCYIEYIRAVFEEEVREKRSGPSIIEKVAGNVFKVVTYHLTNVL